LCLPKFKTSAGFAPEISSASTVASGIEWTDLQVIVKTTLRIDDFNEWKLNWYFNLMKSNNSYKASMKRVEYLEKLKAGRTLCLVRDETLEALVRR
jgi:hypothetical protein